ncbi:MAG: hypothetical protein J6Y02_23880 [Pseudobutyrivibrio sp.]|nr:hypothetical protein [Pseudobutyrivibrio sp.]
MEKEVIFQQSNLICPRCGTTLGSSYTCDEIDNGLYSISAMLNCYGCYRSVTESVVDFKSSPLNFLDARFEKLAKKAYKRLESL